MGLLCLALALPPLSEDQWAQLATTRDGTRPDGAGLYALLPNVMRWNPEELADATDAPAAGAREISSIPGAALWAQPAAYRGQVMLLEGRFAGRQRRMALIRPGPWGEALTEWVVELTLPDGRKRIAVLLLVDPRGRIEPPAVGARIRAVTRFYKLWSDQDAQGRARDYPVFVGRAAQRVRWEGPGVLAIVPAAVLAGLVALLIVLVWVKRLGTPVGRARVGLRHRRATAAQGNDPESMDAAEAHAPPLPADPAEALAQLEQRASNRSSP